MEIKVETIKIYFFISKVEFTIIIGELGVGKSALLNCISVLDKSNSRTVIINVMIFLL